MTGGEGPTVIATGVVKRYGQTAALSGVSLQAAAGAVTALLGPNGAGKTTMIRILATLTRPDAGIASVAGHDVARDPERVRAIIGLTGQSLAVDGKLSGAENLAMIGRLHRLPWPVVRQRSSRLLEAFGLADVQKKAVHTYSGGMRRKLDLALSLVTEPPVLFLDEPTTGLDPASRHALWDVIRGLAGRGSTIMLTTQNLAEADALASSVVFLAAGQVVATGTPAQLKAQAGQAQVELVAATSADLARLTAALGVFQAVADAPGRSVRVPVTGRGTAGLRQVNDITATAARSGARIERFALSEPDLDDVYFQLAGHHRTATAGPAQQDRA